MYVFFLLIYKKSLVQSNKSWDFTENQKLYDSKSFTKAQRSKISNECRSGEYWNGYACVPTKPSGGSGSQPQKVTSKWSIGSQNFNIDLKIGATVAKPNSCRKQYCYAGQVNYASVNNQDITIDDGAYFSLEGNSADDYKILVPKGVNDQTKSMLHVYGRILLEDQNQDKSSLRRSSTNQKGSTSSYLVRQGSGSLDFQAIKNSVSEQLTQADVPSSVQPKKKTRAAPSREKISATTRSRSSQAKKTPPVVSQESRASFQAYSTQRKQQQVPSDITSKAPIDPVVIPTKPSIQRQPIDPVVIPTKPAIQRQPIDPPKLPKPSRQTDQFKIPQPKGRLLQWWDSYQCHEDFYSTNFMGVPITVKSHTDCSLQWSLNLRCRLSIEVTFGGLGNPDSVYFDQRWYYFPGSGVAWWNQPLTFNPLIFTIPPPTPFTYFIPNLYLVYSYSGGFSAYAGHLEHQFYLPAQVQLYSSQSQLYSGWFPFIYVIETFDGVIMDADLTNQFYHRLLGPSQATAYVSFYPVSYNVGWQICFLSWCFPPAPITSFVSPTPPNPSILCTI